jgi:hypothetical protein
MSSTLNFLMVFQLSGNNLSNNGIETGNSKVEKRSIMNFDENTRIIIKS